MKKIKAFLLAVVFILTALSFVACVDGDDDGDTSGLTSSEQLQKIVDTIEGITEAETGAVSSVQIAHPELYFATPFFAASAFSTPPETLEDVEALMTPYDLYRPWGEIKSFFSLITYVAETVGEDALNFVYEITCKNLVESETMSLMASDFQTIDLKGIYDDSIYAVLEGENDGLNAVAIISAYYTDADDYGYEVYCYIDNDAQSKRFEYFSYSKATNALERINTRIKMGEDYCWYEKSGMLTTSTNTEQPIFDIVLNHVRDKKTGCDEVLENFSVKNEVKHQSLYFDYNERYGFIAPLQSFTLINPDGLVGFKASGVVDILAVFDGVVVKAEYDGVVIRHNFGGEIIETHYTSVKNTMLQVGDTVSKGQTIGVTGEGYLYTVHISMYRVIDDGGQLNPLKVLSYISVKG